MNRLLITVPALCFAVLLFPSAIFAAGGGGEPMSMSDILWDLGIKALNVGILGFLAFKYLSGPLNKFVEARSDKIRQELEIAKTAQREAEERLRAFQEKTAGVEEEIEQLRKKTCEDIDREQKLLLDEARQAAEHIRQHARETIRQEMIKARSDLHREAVELASKLAGEIVARNITGDDQQRLVEEYFKEMEASS